MKKRLLSLALSFVMLLTMLPVSVWAEEEIAEMAEVPASVQLPVVNQVTDSRSEEDLLLGYMKKMSGIDVTPEENAMSVSDGIISFPAMSSVALSPTLKRVYDQFDALIKVVAENGGSTEFSVQLTEPIEYSYTEWAQKANDTTNRVIINDEEMTWKEYADTFPSVDAFVEKAISGFNYIEASGLNDIIDEFNSKGNTVFSLLISNNPYELYWYDKVVGCLPLDSGLKYEREGDVVSVYYQITYVFCAASGYRGTTYYPYNADGMYREFFNSVDSSRIAHVSKAIESARRIVKDNENGTDLEKMTAYLAAVKEATSYNYAAVDNNNPIPYGDPWQLIYVFDGDNSTNVVCEGYAKAFKFLCDLSTWSDSDFECILVTGQMDGGTGAGPHMWNIVHIGGDNYLVDPTNCDENTIGAPDKLFLRERESGSYDGTYSFTIDDDSSIAYTYDAETLATFTPGELMLKGDPTPPAQQPRLMWCNNHYDWVGEECFTTHELWDKVNVSMGQVIEGQFVFGTDKAYEPLDLQTLGYEGAAVLNPREESSSDLMVLEAVAFGTMTVTYQHGDESYTLPVTVGLPDVGFYSQTTASKENYLTEWRYNGSNTVYLVWPEGATDVTILPDEHSHTKATATMANGYATITITNLQEDDVAFEVSYQLSGNEVRTHVHLRVVDVRPGLGFYQARNGESGYARENDAALERSFGTVGKGRHREVQFVITGAEEAIVKLSNLVYDEEYIEVKDLGNDCVELAFNKFGDTELSVAVGEETTYSMPITIGLPDLGFYSSPEATEDTYLNEWIYTGEDSVIYLVCQNGRLTKVTGAGDNASGVSATILDGGKAAEIQLTELPDAGHLDVRAEYTRYDDDVSDHGDASVGFLMPQLLVNLSLPEGVSEAAVILWDNEGTAALEPQPQMRRIGSMAVFPNVAPGEYRLTVEHQDCATRTYDITVTQDTVTVLDATLVALGDVNATDGTNAFDMQCLFDYLSSGTIGGALKDDEAYFRAVADVNEDELVNILDYQALYEMVKAQ